MELLFSLTYLPSTAVGVPFDTEEVRGPVIQSPIYSEEGLKSLHPIDLEKLHFEGESLRILRRERSSFRERSETTDLIVEISLQPWEAFHPDGVIIFSDILTLNLPLVSHLTQKKVVKCAGRRGHILNLGHGVLVGTPEEAVAHFFEVARSLKYYTLYQDRAVDSKLVI
ncbi:uroporphyrinogen decarboxylase 1 [Quercus suber]|uniref:Uroporphyrinogen decarboxylase 1 n=1 Tax=Quercus suber TaxID=58331 RepID=A0AAW0M423_QUESU